VRDLERVHGRVEPAAAEVVADGHRELLRHSTLPLHGVGAGPPEEVVTGGW
jgi:hypothetical protein